MIFGAHGGIPPSHPTSYPMLCAIIAATLINSRRNRRGTSDSFCRSRYVVQFHDFWHALDARVLAVVGTALARAPGSAPLDTVRSYGIGLCSERVEQTAVVLDPKPGHRPAAEARQKFFFI